MSKESNLFERWPQTHYIGLVYMAVKEYIQHHYEDDNGSVKTPVGIQLRDIQQQAEREYSRRNGQ